MSPVSTPSGSGGFSPSLRRSDVAISGGASFLASEKMTVKRGGITLDASLVAADLLGNKILKAGTFVATVTATGKYGAYGALTNEKQTITIGGAGLVSFTLTYGGATTAAIAAAATAATVRAALEALATIAVGDITVTGSAATAYTVTFGGQQAAVDVQAITATPTGGTGTVTVATVTAGGAAVADGRQTPDANTSGYLLEGVNLRDGDVICGLLIAGSVLTARVTPAPDATIKAAVAGRILFQ